jgi:hypothetical protein
MAYANVGEDHGTVATFPVQLPQCLTNRFEFMILI